jgi:putative acetyltransferase
MPTFSHYSIRLSQIEDTARVLSLYRDVAEKPGGLARLPFEITSHYVENFLKATVSRGLGFVAVDNNDDIVAEIHSYSPKIFCTYSQTLSLLYIQVFRGRNRARVF